MKKGFLVFSPDNKGHELTEEQFNSLTSFLKTNHVVFTLAEGLYFRNNERSLLVEWTQRNYHLVNSLAKFFAQYSILLVDSDSNCYIKFTKDATEIKIGKWTQVDEKNIDKFESYTKVNNEYFVAL